MSLPLSALKVVELEPNSLSSFCGTILSDFGANVITLHQTKNQQNAIPIENNFLYRGKRSIVLDFKIPSNLRIFRSILKTTDVLLDSYAPGTLEKMGLEPKELLKLNSKLIVCRITGYGQNNSFSHKNGQDINFLATSGLLSTFGAKDKTPEFHGNIMSFGGGSVMGAIGVLMALNEREKTGRGQVIDNAITDCLLYLNSFPLNLKRFNFWNKKRGENLLDSGAPFYRVYQCKGGFLAIGAIEPKFYQDFMKGLKLDKTVEEQCLDNQMNQDMWEELAEIFKQKISEKTLGEWKKIYENLDACVTPVLNFEELPQFDYHIARKNLFMDYANTVPNEFQFQTAPAPKLSNHYEKNFRKKIPKIGENTYEIMKEFNVDVADINEFFAQINNNSKAKL